MADFTLRQIDFFIACIDHGSVAAAATALNVSQPTISLAVAKLESQLGVQLLIRHHSQGVSPSKAGAEMLPEMRALLANAQELENRAKQTAATVSGDIRLGSFSTFAPVILPELIKSLSADHPDIRLILSEGTQETLLRDLTEGRSDAALIYNIDLPRGLRLIPLGSRQPYVALPADHPLAKQKSVALQDLVSEPMILLDVPPSRSYFLGLFKTAGLRPVIAHSSPSLELVRGMVGRGLGYSILVTRPLSDMTYDGFKIVTRPLRDTVASSDLVLASLASVRPTRLIETLEDVMSKLLSGKDGQ